MLSRISEAVTALPQIEIDRIDWEFGANRRPARGVPRLVRSAGGAGKGPRAPSFRPQTAEISGKLVVQQASDFRRRQPRW